MGQENVLWLALSAVTTTGSWVFYYKALKLGDVSTIVLIDKGSFVVAVVLAWLVLKASSSSVLSRASSRDLTGRW